MALRSNIPLLQRVPQRKPGAHKWIRVFVWVLLHSAQAYHHGGVWHSVWKFLFPEQQVRKDNTAIKAWAVHVNGKEKTVLLFWEDSTGIACWPPTLHLIAVHGRLAWLRASIMPHTTYTVCCLCGSIGSWTLTERQWSVWTWGQPCNFRKIACLDTY